MTRNDPASPLELTQIRWRNRETRYDDGRESKSTKVVAMRGNDLYASLEYGKSYPATTRQQQGKRLLDRDGKDTGAAWWDGPDQPGLAHCPASGTWLYDGDDRAEFEATELTEHFSYADRWIERDDDPDHFHVLIDARAVPVEAWPTMGKTDLRNHIKTNGFAPMPGCVHGTGATYSPGPSPRLVMATSEMAAAAIRCRAAADERLRELAPARTGGGGGSGNPGHTGLGHDTEMAGYCLELAHQGLDEDRIYELWCIKASEEEDPAWPFDDSDFARHMRHVYAKVEAFRALHSFPAFTPPPAEVAAAANGSNGNGNGHAPAEAAPAGQVTDPEPEDPEEGEPEGGGDSGPLEVTNSMVLFGVLCRNLGQGQLAGVFNRADELVMVTRYGQVGYKPASENGPTAADPPAQIRPLDADSLVPFIAGRRTCFKTVVKADGSVTYPPALPPAAACKAVVKSPPENWLGVPRMTGVTHTPLIRRDGSILSLPGHDAATGMLYLPDEGIDYRAVPDQPEPGHIIWARDYLLNIIRDFPFVTDGDRANYLGALLTPALRLLLPPPWPQLGINAPQPGSGKSLLATVPRLVYGGEEHSAPETGKQSDVDEELRKVISTILLEHTGSIVVFDNLTGTFRSGKMAKLLTGLHWSDRGLGGLKGVHAINDRLWILTGNNLQVGGDLPRRTIWCNINAKMEHPEQRKVNEPDLPGWVTANRNDILLAVLTLARGAMPGMEQAITATQRRNDSYGRWDAGIRHVLRIAGLGAWGFWEAQTAVARVGADDEEWSTFLAAIHSAWPGKQFTARQLAEACVVNAPMERFGKARSVLGDALPGKLLETLSKNMSDPAVITRTLGAWFRNRQDRWTDGYMAGCTDTKQHNNTVWFIKHAE